MWQSKPHFTAQQKKVIVFNDFIVVLFYNMKY